MGAAAIPALSCPTGGDVVSVATGSVLNTAAATAGKTYELASGGTYSVTATISLTSGTTCYRGLGAGATILVSTGSADNSGRAFSASSTAILGLENVVVDGQNAHPGAC